MPTTDPIQMLKDDHEKVKRLFRDFEAADGPGKQQVARQAIMELEVHAMLEEEIFYPAFLENVKEEFIAAEAEEEHHVARMLIQELKSMLDRSPDVHFEAKFVVLAEGVKHHIQEEESEILPKASRMSPDLLNQLGEQMMQRKQELVSQAGSRAA